jgi:hypothetical protein
MPKRSVADKIRARGIVVQLSFLEDRRHRPVAFERVPRAHHYGLAKTLQASFDFADEGEVTTHARFVGSGVQPLVDAVKAAGADPGDLRAVVWQATWARGYEDVVAPAPAARLKESGFVVFSRGIGDDRYAAIVDTSHALWAIVARGKMPSLGSQVKIVPAFDKGEIGWNVTVVEALGLGITVRFGAKVDENSAWAEHLRSALVRIGDAEIANRKAIVLERRSLASIEPVQPLRDELDRLHEALRLRVDAETAGTPAERAAFARGNEKQRKAIVDECKARRLRRYNEELALLREQMPELTAAHEKKALANAQSRAAVAELEDAASRSRGITERLESVENQLAAVETSGLLVSADLDVLDAVGSSEFVELSRSVELLFALIPRRAQKRTILG